MHPVKKNSGKIIQFDSKFNNNTIIIVLMLFGVFAVHSPESCPLNNEHSKKIFLDIQSKMDLNLSKFNINKIIGFYMSVLEHQWVIIFDAESAHKIEQFCIEVGISAISTVKIVPMNYFSDTIEKMKSHTN